MASHIQRSNGRLVQEITSSRQRPPLSHDPSSLTRKPTSRPPTKSSDSSHRILDSSSLVRKSSNRLEPPDSFGPARTSAFRRSNPQDPPSLSRKQSHHPLAHPRTSSSTPTEHSKLTKHASSRNDIFSEEEREDRRRKRNRESARRARERERSERELMEKAYDANEVRIKHLEDVVDSLSGELRRHNTISTVTSPKTSSGRGKGKGSKYDSPEDRPSWFGAAF